MPEDRSLAGSFAANRRLPLSADSFDAQGPAPVVLSLRWPVSIVSITARRGHLSSLSSLVSDAYGVPLPATGRSTSSGGISFRWFGPGHFHAVSDGPILDRLMAVLAPIASLSDLSHGRIIFRITGTGARDALARACSVDLHPGVFGCDCAAATQIGHASAHISQVDEDCFEISVSRSYASGFRDWLQIQLLGSR